MIFSLYFRTLLSVSISFLLHAFNFKKHVHSFLTLVTITFNNNTTPNSNIATTTDNNNNNNNNNKLHLKRQIHPMPLVLPPPPIHDLMVCTESIGFESIDERIVDEDHDSEDEFEDGNYCLRRKTVAERRENINYTFPPPLSSLDGNGHPNFILLPVRMNGRLQLSKVRVKRPEILCATREDGRLRLYLVPDHEYSILDDGEEMEEEEYLEEVGEEEEISAMVESESESEEEIMIMGEEEEISRNEEFDDDREVREWKLRGAGGDNETGLIIRRCHSVGDNERLIRKCHQMVNLNYGIHYRHHLYGSHHNLHMFGVGIA